MSVALTAAPGAATAEGAAQVPIAGAWLVEIDRVGETAAVPVQAANEGAIPVWLGYLFALSPLAGLVWFQLRQWGRAKAAMAAAA